MINPIDPDNGVADPWCVPMCSLSDMEGGALERMAPAERAEIEAHFNAFAAPGFGCIRCGVRGGFTWGIAHGEGHCDGCGWPARAYHFLTVGGQRERFVMVLQYHPIYVSRRKPGEQEDAA